jgi:hypothetical protein
MKLKAPSLRELMLTKDLKVQYKYQNPSDKIY